MLSFDEWNVWYKTHKIEHMRKPGWPEAPHLIEEIYNAEDALIVGGALIALMNNADRVKTACIAQLVNVIGPIMTETGGAAWRQTIFHPFALAARHGHGRVLQAKAESPGYAAQSWPEIPYLYATVVDNPADGTTTVFALNRSLSDPMDLDVALRGLGLDSGDSSTQIVPAIVGDEGRALALAATLEQRGLLAVAIRPPTVPAGTSRLRIALSAAHRDADIDRLIDGLTAALA